MDRGMMLEGSSRQSGGPAGSRGLLGRHHRLGRIQRWRSPTTRHMGRERGAGGPNRGCITGAVLSEGMYEGKAAATDRDDDERPRICILGGGFGGLYTALRLSSLVWRRKKKPKITIVDRNSRFVFKPLLYELLTEELGDDEVAPAYSSLLGGTGINFVQGNVANISPKGSEDSTGYVDLENEERIPYDYLVLAFGSQTKMQMVPGVKEHATPFGTFDDATKLRQYLKASASDCPTVVIVGSGVNGVELASSIADKYKGRVNLKLISPGEDILPSHSDSQRQTARNVLSRRKVDIVPRTTVKGIEKNASGDYSLAVDNDGGRESITADKVIWTAGQEPVHVPRASDANTSFVPKDERGSVLTDDTLKIKGCSYGFALGDVAVAGRNGERLQLPFTAQVAFQQADYVAWNLWSAINNQPLLPFQYQNLGEMMSLGSWDASVALPVGPNLSGSPASLLRKLAYVYRMPTVEQSVRLGLSWTLKFLRGELGSPC
mmetsp:Transcript_6775/g.17268  ORF Transcript_6775/g.17268 Transcript_6775/m.17268 type:complete len:491 (+) Transcript_6775:263-1735(+)